MYGGRAGVSPTERDAKLYEILLELTHILALAQSSNGI